MAARTKPICVSRDRLRQAMTTARVDRRENGSVPCCYLVEGTTKPDDVVKIERGSSPPKYDVTREELGGGPTSGRHETG